MGILDWIWQGRRITIMSFIFILYSLFSILYFFSFVFHLDHNHVFVGFCRLAHEGVLGISFVCIFSFFFSFCIAQRQRNCFMRRLFVWGDWDGGGGGGGRRFLSAFVLFLCFSIFSRIVLGDIGFGGGRKGGGGYILGGYNAIRYHISYHRRHLCIARSRGLKSDLPIRLVLIVERDVSGRLCVRAGGR